jgi:hypothetical protein
LGKRLCALILMGAVSIDGRGDPEYWPAVVELGTTGRYWIGGGAAPLVLLMPC